MGADSHANFEAMGHCSARPWIPSFNDDFTGLYSDAETPHILLQLTGSDWRSVDFKLYDALLRGRTASLHVSVQPGSTSSIHIPGQEVVTITRLLSYI